ncbi:hypothetical protein UNSWDHB_2454 [Dehalobacter sp. UNSWDHB]|nr:hypothetical protein UNSWDHB_2454 [Dehalobacter sp. UNSWDHB]
MQASSFIKWNNIDLFRQAALLVGILFMSVYAASSDLEKFWGRKICL